MVKQIHLLILSPWSGHLCQPGSKEKKGKGLNIFFKGGLNLKDLKLPTESHLLTFLSSTPLNSHAEE